MRAAFTPRQVPTYGMDVKARGAHCRTLNLGIVAHVDAGKTSLTERILYEAGVIEAPGSVDAGDTQTDSMALERQRGITIRAAVVSFDWRSTTVNLIDTPGHSDFIAEVERALAVLDAAVLVVSAVEGVQAQTLVLMRALQRLGPARRGLRQQGRPLRRRPRPGPRRGRQPAQPGGARPRAGERRGQPRRGIPAVRDGQHRARGPSRPGAGRLGSPGAVRVGHHRRGRARAARRADCVAARRRPRHHAVLPPAWCSRSSAPTAPGPCSRASSPARCGSATGWPSTARRPRRSPG